MLTADWKTWLSDHNSVIFAAIFNRQMSPILINYLGYLSKDTNREVYNKNCWLQTENWLQRESRANKILLRLLILHTTMYIKLRRPLPINIPSSSIGRMSAKQPKFEYNELKYPPPLLPKCLLSDPGPGCIKKVQNRKKNSNALATATA